MYCVSLNEATQGSLFKYIDSRELWLAENDRRDTKQDLQIGCSGLVVDKATSNNKSTSWPAMFHVLEGVS